jgi:hypothetical protein
VIGKSWCIRLCTTARRTADGKLVPVTSPGKIAHDDDGKIISRQFHFRLGDVSKFSAKGSGLGLAVAGIKADIEQAEKSIGLNVEAERPNDMLVSKFFTDVFMPHARQEKEVSTQLTYGRYWTAYLSEHFNGTKTLKTYQPHVATDFLESLCPQKRSENTVLGMPSPCVVGNRQRSEQRLKRLHRPSETKAKGVRCPDEQGPQTCHRRDGRDPGQACTCGQQATGSVVRRGSPRTDKLIAASVQWAEKIWIKSTTCLRTMAGNSKDGRRELHVSLYSKGRKAEVAFASIGIGFTRPGARFPVLTKDSIPLDAGSSLQSL